VGGWDFAFSAPKCISLALTFGHADTRRDLLAAHRAAANAALVPLDRLRADQHPTPTAC
jgi:hypothetical protein